MPGYHETLLQLTYIRVATLFGISALLLAALYLLGAQMAVWPLVLTLGVTALVNLFTYARLHSHWPVTEPELFSQLCADAVLYGALIYQTGGATNPFIFMLLIPLLISAATLGWRYTTLMALLVVLLYSSLLHYYLPLLQPQSDHSHSLAALIDLHVTGMWLNFLFTTLLITWFIVRMQQIMRRQERRLIRERERRMPEPAADLPGKFRRRHRPRTGHSPVHHEHPAQRAGGGTPGAGSAGGHSPAAPTGGCLCSTAAGHDPQRQRSPAAASPCRRTQCSTSCWRSGN